MNEDEITELAEEIISEIHWAFEETQLNLCGNEIAKDIRGAIRVHFMEKGSEPA